jgi:hypothetical protein
MIPIHQNLLHQETLSQLRARGNRSVSQDLIKDAMPWSDESRALSDTSKGDDAKIKDQPRNGGGNWKR